METSPEIMYKLGAIESLLKSLSDELKASIKDSKEVHKDHEDRLKRLETGQTKSTTINGIIASGVSAVIAFAIAWYTH